jgi:hypothetical protein
MPGVVQLVIIEEAECGLPVCLKAGQGEGGAGGEEEQEEAGRHPGAGRVLPTGFTICSESIFYLHFQKDIL